MKHTTKTKISCPKTLDCDQNDVTKETDPYENTSELEDSVEHHEVLLLFGKARRLQLHGPGQPRELG